MGELGLADSVSGRRQYAQRMRRRAVEETAGENDTPEREQLRRGWCLGGEGFREKMLGIMDRVEATRHVEAGGTPPLNATTAKATPDNCWREGWKYWA